VTYPQTCIAVLRLVVGAWFIKAVWTKLTLAYVAGVLPYPAVSPRFLAFHPKRVAEFAADNPVDWYKAFLQNTVLPHASLFATLQTYGEVVVGLGLILGLFTRLTAVIGLVLSLNYGLATQWMTFGQQGFHLLLITSMVIFLVAGAGRAWGLDAVLLPRLRALRWLG
jgi:thiosulfate dehydrogenase (quinone) large subunit